MKNVRLLALLLTGSLFSLPAFAAGAKTYQVTGPILEVTDAVITVQKGKETWQIDRSKDTKVTGDLKVGAKVTIQYRMSADSIEAKGGGKEVKADAKADAKAAPADAKAGPGAAKAPAAPAAAPAKK
jgi:hypothetical protein